MSLGLVNNLSSLNKRNETPKNVCVGFSLWSIHEALNCCSSLEIVQAQFLPCVCLCIRFSTIFCSCHHGIQHNNLELFRLCGDLVFLRCFLEVNLCLPGWIRVICSAKSSWQLQFGFVSFKCVEIFSIISLFCSCILVLLEKID